jgi:TonB family protein
MGFYNIKEYYRNGKLKLVGKTSATTGSMLQGQCISFFPTGKRKSIATYSRGKPQGDVYNYYPNGKLYNVLTFANNVINTNDLMSPGIIVKACYDTTGKVLLENGSGHLVSYDDDFKIILDEGDVNNGKKIGTWKGYDTTDTITFTEQYELGKLIEGTGTNSHGKVEHYTQRQVSPEFPGGESGLSHFLSKNIKYPPIAKKYNIQGKVFISFVIEKDGSLDQIKVLREPGSGTGDEVMRVIQLSPNWKPGTRYGHVSKIKFTLPVNFSLGER